MILSEIKPKLGLIDQMADTQLTQKAVNAEKNSLLLPTYASEERGLMQRGQRHSPKNLKTISNGTMSRLHLQLQTKNS